MKLKERFYRIWNWRKYRRFKGFENKLQGALANDAKKQRDREVDQLILKFEIKRHMRRFLKVDARSRFIPHDNKSNEICRQEVEAKFGAEMEKLGVYLRADLTLCTQ